MLPGGSVGLFNVLIDQSIYEHRFPLEIIPLDSIKTLKLNFGQDQVFTLKLGSGSLFHLLPLAPEIEIPLEDL